MIIPNFENTKVVDENGFLTPVWQLIFQQLITNLQGSLSDEGFLIPQQTTATITTLMTNFNASASPSKYFGNSVYDSTVNKLKVNENGTIKTVVTV